ncbi:MAG: bifunctional folylpolyglutamate synthase/dihydrofolate synthase [Oculatellaceae cyanobacterium Prado106]|nr:bifunctional folylpolyglutamate synthase/dihydrofolate synthase [Oculatellaceae cyanobacterium Prado106]
MNSADFAKTSALQEVDKLLNGVAHFGVELGLERIERLLAALGNPQQQVPIVHVAGSNGKGSTCAYSAAVLTAAGYRVGRYISPHLISWCERISLNGTDIQETELLELLQKVMAAIDPNYPSPTQFEIITAAAWLYFAQQQVDIAVMEVGLGGRLDATNVCDRPLVSVITSLSREHWQRLGPTLADITREKAGILKPSRPAVIAPQPPEAMAVLQRRLEELDCPTTWVEPAVFQDLSQDNSGTYPWAQWRDVRYPLALPGQHQLVNSALAIATLQILQQQGWQITPQHIIQGMNQTQWPARLQWLQWQGKDLLIDGAHNSAGAQMLRKYVDQSSRVTHPVSWVMGMIANKDHAEVFQALLQEGDRLYLVPVPDHASLEMQQLADLANQVCPHLMSCTIHSDVFEGLTAAFTQTAGTTVLCGSLYLLGHFLALRSPS